MKHSPSAGFVLLLWFMVNGHIQHCSKDCSETIQGTPQKLICVQKAVKQE